MSDPAANASGYNGPVRPKMLLPAAAIVVLAATATLSQDKPATVIDIDTRNQGPALDPQMFGIFFEDINFAADGGLYPELIKNRSFEFDDPVAGWKQILNDQGAQGLGTPNGEMSIQTASPLNASNTHYLRLRADHAGFGVSNSGFRGIGVRTGGQYRFSAYVRTSGPQHLRAVLVDDHGQQIGTATLSGFGKEWKRYEAILTPAATTQHAVFRMFVDETNGPIDIDMVSLFPVDTWKGRPNGLRKDLVQLLYDMHPGFIRFPGGCIVEGRRLATRYRWKTTVGDIAQRKTLINRWNNEFDHRPAPDYFQSFGLGFYEYFQLAEDIGARPLPILNCGMACEFNTSELAPLDQTREYIQDALDLIEFANGATNTPWGHLRAQMGHPEPFHLTMIGVGNEQWGPHYVERYELFAKELKAKHPEIKLVAAAGPSPSGEQFNYLWSNWRRLHADLVDEHYYVSPDWFFKNAGRYDNYDRSGPKVFAGEYAAQTDATTSPNNRNNWKTALSEAAFMTGLERNGDVVRMASYAPLFAHVDAWQWKPDAIWFDNLRSYGTPNYYVQQLFAANTGTRLLHHHGEVPGLYTNAVYDNRTHEVILKLVNSTASAIAIDPKLNGAEASAPAKMIVLSSALDAENDFEHPKAVAPVVNESSGAVNLPPYSATVLRLRL